MQVGWRDGGPTRWWQWPGRVGAALWQVHRNLAAARAWYRASHPYGPCIEVWELAAVPHEPAARPLLAPPAAETQG